MDCQIELLLFQKLLKLLRTVANAIKYHLYDTARAQNRSDALLGNETKKNLSGE